MSQAVAALTRWTKTGIALMACSLVIWLVLPLIPFLPLSVGARVTLAGGTLVAAEVFFWLGALLAGPEATRRARSWFRGRREGDVDAE